MTQMELASSLKAAYRGNWTQDLDAVLARKLPEFWEEFGEYRLSKGTDRMIENEQYFTIAMWREHVIETPLPPAKPLDRDSECSLCHDTKWVNGGNGRMVRCECPPEERVKYQGIRVELPNFDQLVKKHRLAVDTENPPANPDNSLGFYLEEQNGEWILFDRSLPIGARKAGKYEVLLWRSGRFWKGAFFGLKEQKAQ